MLSLLNFSQVCVNTLSFALSFLISCKVSFQSLKKQLNAQFLEKSVLIKSFEKVALGPGKKRIDR